MKNGVDSLSSMELCWREGVKKEIVMPKNQRKGRKRNKTSFTKPLKVVYLKEVTCP